jgi:hypothetical protein
MFLCKSAVRATLFAILLSAGRALACSCAPPPPPCQAIGETSLVFLGTVTRMSDLSTAQMQVDHLYKGKIKDTIQLFDDGMCDGPRLEAGGQYLMYTTVVPTGDIPARGCTRSRAVEAADEDLEFLKQYSAGKVLTHISGSVSLQPDPSVDRNPRDEEPLPMKDVRVTVSIGDKHFSTNTNSLGHYSFTGLPPGEYDISAEFPGHRLTEPPEDLTLDRNGCVETDLTMKVDRRVQGVVRDANGTPVSEIMVEMVPVKRNPERWREPRLLTLTDEQGRYAINGIPPGDYYLGININSTPTKQRPYAATYYPNTPDIAQALQIVLAPGPLTYDLDLRLPGRLPLVTIQGRVLNPDGSPPRSEDYPRIAIEEPGLSGQIEGGPISVDAEGWFEFELCEGVSYSAYAFAGTIRTQRYSAPIAFTPTKENNRLLLILDKTSEEFQKASDAMEVALLPGK